MPIPRLLLMGRTPYDREHMAQAREKRVCASFFYSIPTSDGPVTLIFERNLPHFGYNDVA